MLKSGDECPLDCGGFVFQDENTGGEFFCDGCGNQFSDEGETISTKEAKK